MRQQQCVLLAPVTICGFTHQGAQKEDESTYNNILKKGLTLRQAFCVN